MKQEAKKNQTSDEELKTANDCIFKTLVRDSKVLPMMLQSNIDELKDKSIEEILSCLKIGKDGRTVIGKETEDIRLNEGAVRMDSVFDVSIPGTDEMISVIVNIEGQSNPNPGYPLVKRAEYYIARLVSSQKGTVFKDDDYGKMRKTYSIWYVLNPKAEERNTIIRYSMKSKNVYGKERKMPVLDTFNIIFVNVGRYDSTLPDSVAFPSVLFKLPEDERYNVMKDRFNIEIDDLLSRELKDMEGIGQDNYDRGYDQGIQQGIQQGKEEGREEELFAMTMSLVKEKGWTVEEALSISSASEGIKDSVRKRVIELS